jgi:DNA polymerase
VSTFVGVRIDIESRSRTGVDKGAYVYAEDPDFAVLIISYAPLRQLEDGSIKRGRPRRLDLNDPDAVARFSKILTDPRFQKHAFNANFERIALSKWLGMPNGIYLDPENWRCSAVQANVAGVFGTLDEVAKAVRSPIKKDAEGKRLIRLFSIPDKKTDRFVEPHEAPQDFARFGTYCDQDVATEGIVSALLPPIAEDIQAQYEADQRINDRGIGHNRKLAEQAVLQVKSERDRLMAELTQMTGLDNPNSGKQFHGWLDEQGYSMDSLDKAHRAEALADPAVPEQVAEALTLKGAASLSSVSKHQAALNTRCRDGRIRGSLRFYGAHTGREAGRGIQPQNLPRYEAPRADRLRLVSGNAGADAPTIAKGTVRASLVPARGNALVVVDYNAIEARCLGWEAGEKWVEDEFRYGDGAIYEATAEQMFGVNKQGLLLALKACDKCGSCIDCGHRSKGKVSNLALGYAGGAGALVTMGAEEAGIDIGNYADLHREWEQGGKPGKFHEWERDRHDYPELLRLRDLYRDASPATVRFWKNCARAWDVACSGKAVRFGQNQMITMLRDGRHNRLVLPSGRSIWYRFARSHADKNNPDRIDRRTFIGKSKGVGHMRVDTHGGKLTENITQAVARDVLFDLIMKIERMTKAGWPGRLVLHVHDEVVLEVPKTHAEQVLADVKGLMDSPPDWAPGLVVKGAGSIMERYGK